MMRKSKGCYKCISICWRVRCRRCILKGDIWTISAVGTLGGVAVSLGRYCQSTSDAPVQVVGSWSIAEGNLGYTPYNSSNPGYISNLGTVTSIGLSGGTTGMTFLLPLQVVE
jgi:hypothetical protein